MITNLYFTLKEKYESGKFALLCIAEGQEESVDDYCNLDGVYLRFIDVFAPAANTKEEGNHKAWQDVFAEFLNNKHKFGNLNLFLSGIKEKGFKHTVQILFKIIKHT